MFANEMILKIINFLINCILELFKDKKNSGIIYLIWDNPAQIDTFGNFGF